MKTLFSIMVFSLALATFAAPSEGETKAGEPTQSGAAPSAAGSIEPKELAKDKLAPKLKDDGTCWAVTEAGTRCKHKKNGDSDYCKQHAPSVKPSKPVKQCRAMTYDGKQCVRPPVEGGRYCKQHNK